MNKPALSEPTDVARTAAGSVVVRAVGVSKHFTRGADTVKALDDVSFELPYARLIVLKGRSGCGKSTLLNMLGALDRPTAGTILVDGIDVGALQGSAEVAYRRSKVGIVFQSFNLIPQLSALENVILPMELTALAKREREERGRALLSQVGIDANRFEHRPSRLSGGQQQRVAIARALANNPSILLGDEPTGNLDSETSGHIVALLHDLATRGRTVIVATHDEEIAANAHMVVNLRDGRIASVVANEPTALRSRQEPD